MHTFLSRLLILFVLGGALIGIWVWRLQPLPPLSPEPLQTEAPAPVIEATYVNASPDLITVTSPTPGQAIASPLFITGQARGPWYFEATAPVILVNWDGLIVAEGYVTAQDDWMTEDFIPFEGTLTFTTEDPSLSSTFLYPNATLILKNDNPSGEPEYDRAVEIPLLFSLP